MRGSRVKALRRRFVETVGRAPTPREWRRVKRLWKERGRLAQLEAARTRI